MGQLFLSPRFDNWGNSRKQARKSFRGTVVGRTLRIERTRRAKRLGASHDIAPFPQFQRDLIQSEAAVIGMLKMSHGGGCAWIIAAVEPGDCNPSPGGLRFMLGVALVVDAN